MKNNTEGSKALLQKALAEIGQDYALTDVRYHIRAALGKLEHVEKKRERREVHAEKRDLARGQGNAYAFDPLRALEAINEEIARTKSELQDIRNRRNQPKEMKDEGDDEFSTIHG